MTIKSISSNKLQPLDFFGRKFKFNFNGRTPHFKTPLGGCFITLMIAIIVPILVIFGRRWIRTSKPTVSVNNIINNRNDRYQLNEGTIFSGLMLSVQWGRLCPLRKGWSICHLSRREIDKVQRFSR